MDIHQPTVNYRTDRLDAFTEANSAMARESFAAFRRTIRPVMLWSPFVSLITRELQKFYEAFESGKRPKLALMTPPQHGKSWIAEDFIAWVAGKHPAWKMIYASSGSHAGDVEGASTAPCRRYLTFLRRLRAGLTARTSIKSTPAPWLSPISRPAMGTITHILVSDKQGLPGYTSTRSTWRSQGGLGEDTAGTADPSHLQLNVHVAPARMVGRP